MLMGGDLTADHEDAPQGLGAAFQRFGGVSAKVPGAFSSVDAENANSPLRI
jgi:hypothetical protein